MVHRKDADPSPFRSGLLHGLMSVGLFSGVACLVGGVVHMTGDPVQAGPQHVIALFQTESGDTPDLRIRSLAGARSTTVLAASTPTGAGTQTIEPSLGVSDPVSTPATPPVRNQQTGATPRGIRINGKLVSPGQRYSEVEQGAAASPEIAATVRPTLSDASIQAALAEPDPAAQKSNFARPFDNPDGKPIVSLVIGGLGTSYRYSISAIDELPAEVTLSFIPNANPELLKYARQKGHEILLEVPMETQGNRRGHRDTLLANAPAADNILRLNALLRGKKELLGVISHQGEKFVNSQEAVTPVLQHLRGKGLAFFQHSGLQRAGFSEQAEALNLDFAAAQENIDTEIRTSEIEAQLFKLEAQAMEEGAAFGTGFAYPLTVDTVSRWSRRLESKGILLAPASAVAAENAKQRGFQTSQLELANTPSDATP